MLGLDPAPNLPCFKHTHIGICEIFEDGWSIFSARQHTTQKVLAHLLCRPSERPRLAYLCSTPPYSVQRSQSRPGVHATFSYLKSTPTLRSAPPSGCNGERGSVVAGYYLCTAWRLLSHGAAWRLKHPRFRSSVGCERKKMQNGSSAGCESQDNSSDGSNTDVEQYLSRRLCGALWYVSFIATHSRRGVDAL